MQVHTNVTYYSLCESTYIRNFTSNCLLKGKEIVLAYVFVYRPESRVKWRCWFCLWTWRGGGWKDVRLTLPNSYFGRVINISGAYYGVTHTTKLHENNANIFQWEFLGEGWGGLWCRGVGIYSYGHVRLRKFERSSNSGRNEELMQYHWKFIRLNY